MYIHAHAIVDACIMHRDIASARDEIGRDTWLLGCIKQSAAARDSLFIFHLLGGNVLRVHVSHVVTFRNSMRVSLIVSFAKLHFALFDAWKYNNN